jgi:hypothetical protein
VLQAASMPALTGDVANSAGSLSTTIQANAVSYSKFQHGRGLEDTVLENGLPKQVPATLSRVAATALIQAYADEANLDGETKVKRFALAMKVTGAKKLGLAAEEIAVLKERIGKAYGPLIVGRAYQLLDPAALK